MCQLFMLLIFEVAPTYAGAECIANSDKGSHNYLLFVVFGQGVGLLFTCEKIKKKATTASGARGSDIFMPFLM